MNYKAQIISLLLILFISLAIGLYLHHGLFEGAATMSQTYESTAIEATKAQGHSTGYAGSGANVTADNTNYSKYSNAPNKTSFDNLSKYKVGNAGDLNIQYHETPEQIAAEDSLKGNAVIRDKDGNVILLPPIQAQEQVTYYQPGTFVYGSSSYVPSYEDSVYLSRTAGGAYLDSKYSKPITSASYIQGGICKYYENNPDGLEKACNSVDANTCASTSCCVLLGGSKCVSGNERGATMKANYSDIYIKNRDYYYFQGKCYGNCP